MTVVQVMGGGGGMLWRHACLDPVHLTEEDRSLGKGRQKTVYLDEDELEELIRASADDQETAALDDDTGTAIATVTRCSACAMQSTRRQSFMRLSLSQLGK